MKAGFAALSRAILLLFALLEVAPAGADDYAQVSTDTSIQFPRDAGSHPQFRTEWWYLTGWVKKPDGSELGIQITFFRNRPRVAEFNPSRFAPRQLLFAHAALADAKRGRLLHDQRAARAGFGLADAKEEGTDVWVDDWSLKRTGSIYSANIVARDFSFALQFKPTQAVLLEGERGVSRKGPQPAQASYYYSEPQLEVSGSIDVAEKKLEVSGKAWLDHEWSSEYLAADAAGWDWTGINFADGAALMAFRIRDKRGSTFWAGGTIRDRDGKARALKPDEVRFEPLRRWRSPRSGAEYPVAMALLTGGHELQLEPLMDDQEIDARASTGTIYWEGAVRARGEGKLLGMGYLELTGYWKPLRM